MNNRLKIPTNPIYGYRMNCIYNDSIPDGKVMRLKFHADPIFDLESDSGCR